MKQQYEEQFLEAWEPKVRPMWKYKLCWAVALLFVLAVLASIPACKTPKTLEEKRKVAMGWFEKAKAKCDADSALMIVPPQFAHKYWPVKIKWLPGKPIVKPGVPEVKKGQVLGFTFNIDSAFRAGVKSWNHTCPRCDTFYFRDTVHTVDTMVQTDSAAIRVLEFQIIDANKATLKAEDATRKQVDINQQLRLQIDRVATQRNWGWLAFILLAIINAVVLWMMKKGVIR